MDIFVISWAISAAAVVAIIAAVGAAITGHPAGALIDSRGRCSLTQFQLLCWTTVVVSLIAGVAAGRVITGSSDPLDFVIPQQLLTVIGISAGGAVVGVAIKSGQDLTRTSQIAAAVLPPKQPRNGSGQQQPRANADHLPGPDFSQIFMQEQGAYADRVVDITKLQNFVITLVLVAGYVISTVSILLRTADPEQLRTLPGFGPHLVVLLGISQASYLAGKLPSQAGQPAFSLSNRQERVAAAAATPTTPPGAGLLIPNP